MHLSYCNWLLNKHSFSQLEFFGFLIAGFSIFASVTKTKLFVTLAKIQYGDTDINRLPIRILQFFERIHGLPGITSTFAGNSNRDI